MINAFEFSLEQQLPWRLPDSEMDGSYWTWVPFQVEVNVEPMLGEDWGKRVIRVWCNGVLVA